MEVEGIMVLFGAIAVLAVSIKCVLPRLLPMCLGKLPRDAVPLSAEDAQSPFRVHS